VAQDPSGGSDITISDVLSLELGGELVVLCAASTPKLRRAHFGIGTDLYGSSTLCSGYPGGHALRSLGQDCREPRVEWGLDPGL